MSNEQIEYLEERIEELATRRKSQQDYHVTLQAEIKRLEEQLETSDEAIGEYLATQHQLEILIDALFGTLTIETLRRIL